MKQLILVLALALAAPAAADPNPQLVRSIENGLKRYGLEADVSQFATSTVGALHFSLSDSSQGYFKKRHELQAILRNAVYKQGRP